MVSKLDLCSFDYAVHFSFTYFVVLLVTSKMLPKEVALGL